MNRPQFASLFFPAAALALLALAAFSFPYAALEDFPEWVFQGYVFDKLAAGATSPLFELKHHPVPYALLQLVVSGAVLVASPMVASKLVIAIFVVVALVAVHLFIRRNDISPAIGWPLLLSIAVLNAPFWNGYMGYQSGIVVLLFYLALPRPARSDWRWLALFSLLAFFAHGWGYIALLAFAGAYALYDRRIVSCGAAILPSLALLAWYEKANQVHGDLKIMFDVRHVNPVLYKIYTLLKSGPYHNAIAFDFNAAAHFGPGYVAVGLAFDALFFGAAAALAILAVRRLGWRSVVVRPELLTGVALVGLALAMPPAGFEMANPGERIMIPGLIALILAFFAGFRPKSPTFVVRAPQAALGGALLGGMALFGLGLTASGAAYRAGVAGIERPAGSEAPTASIYAWFGHRLVQFDQKMRVTEGAWRDDSLPDMPLAFETGLIEAPRAVAHQVVVQR